MDDPDLSERLRAIEARHLGVATSADRDLREKPSLRAWRGSERRAHEAEDTFSATLPDPSQRALFLALARRYGLRPHRHARQRRTTVVVTAPVSFYEHVFWPEFSELAGALGA